MLRSIGSNWLCRATGIEFALPLGEGADQFRDPAKIKGVDGPGDSGNWLGFERP
jgi:hypothetical protein